MSVSRATAWMRRFAERLRQNKEYLTDLDSAIGDADHGINMDRGFTAVVQKLEATEAEDLGTLFRLIGTTLISSVGGASGPLYGTAFLRMGGALAGKSSASAAELGAALDLACEGVAARGRSGRGEKTMLDAFWPAVDAFQSALRRGQPLGEIAATSAGAAEYGAGATIPLIATKGRASYLAERSAGHQDPGATSTMYLFQTLAESLRD